MAIRVQTVGQEYAYLAKNPCACGGEWEPASQSSSNRGAIVTDHIEVRCGSCGKTQSFEFEIDRNDPAYLADLQATMDELEGDAVSPRPARRPRRRTRPAATGERRTPVEILVSAFFAIAIALFYAWRALQ